MSPADEIRNLLGVYTELMDAGEWTAVGQLFAHADLVTEDATPIASGADAVRALYEGGTKLYEGSPRTRHVTANSVVDVDGRHGDRALELHRVPVSARFPASAHHLWSLPGQLRAC